MTTSEGRHCRTSRSTTCFAPLLTLLLLSAVLGTAGASDGANAETPPTPLRVVATFSVLGDWLANVAATPEQGGSGERELLVDLTVLVGADSDAHVFEPTPRHVLAIANADLVVEAGLGFEAWLDALYDASGSSAARVVTSGALPALTGADVDPHFWLSVTNAMLAVAAVADALAAADPVNATAYGENAAAYLSELAALDAYVRDQLASVPQERRLLVTNHDNFRYFAEEYGFEVLATLAPSSTDVADMSGREMARVTEAIRQSAAPAIFVEHGVSGALAERLAEATGVAVAPALYTDSLGAPGSEGATYVGALRHDADTIAGALR